MKKAHSMLVCLLILFFCSCTQKGSDSIIASASEINEYLHVPSPDWEDQIMYFIVTDRFMDGDTTNNDQGQGEYQRGNGNFWNGGDLKGITQKIDYIKELGATSIWITPPVANQWRNPQKTGTGNHGYWANNFVEVDKHYGTLEDYQELSASLHKNNIYLIQDIVVNHLGDFFTYTGPYNPDDVTQNFHLRKVTQPTQFPFNHNNAKDPKDLEMGIYHFTPSFNDHSDTIKKRLYQFADLDDLNTANPVVRKALRASYNHWIKNVGVDGFRFDTAIFVEHEFWHDFIHSQDKEDPGVENFARSLGIDKFLTFGEALIPTAAYDNQGVLETAQYLGSNEKPEMTSVLNFPLYFSIQRVFQEMKSTDLFTHRLKSLDQAFPRPELLLNFIDNHDGARFLRKATHSSFRQAMVFMMTIPGIPIIYYGTEQEFLGTRQTMFKGGVGSPDQDHFNTDNASFKFVQNLIRLRKENAAFRKGKVKVLRDSPGGPGTLSYRLQYNNENAFVLFNTSEKEKLADNISTGLEPGTVLKTLYKLNHDKAEFVVDQFGELNEVLPPKSILVLASTNEKKKVEIANVKIKIDPLKEEKIIGEKIKISGQSVGVDNLQVVIDGDLASASSVIIEENGNWSAELTIHHLTNGKHLLTAYGKQRNHQIQLVSDNLEIEVELPTKRLKTYTDEKGDDHGPNGVYEYPAHPSYTNQMDIETVQFDKMGANLKIELTMAGISQEWLPPNKFDHALINIYIDLPGKKGQQLLPFQNAQVPENGDWDYLISTAAFDNAVFTSEGASAENPGKATGPSPAVTADKEKRTITFVISSEVLAYPESLSGIKVYINTWGGAPASLRNLNEQASNWDFSGGTNSDPKIMDDTKVIKL